MAINVTPDVTWQGNDVFEGTSFNIPIPAGVLTGMFLILGITFADNQTSLTSVTIPGWTQFTAAWTGTDKYAFYKIATSTDQSNAGTGDWVCACDDGFIEQWAGAGWNGVNATTPFAVGPSIGSGFGSTTWAFNSITSPGTGSVWVGLYLQENNGGATTDPTPPPTNQVASTSPYYTGPAIIYSAQVNSGAFAPSGSMGAGVEIGTVALFLNPAGGGGGAISGSTGITFGQSGALAGAGALTGSGAVTFGQSGVLKGNAALAGTTNITFGQAGNLTGAGALAASTAITFGQSGTLSGSGALLGTTAITFGQTGNLIGAGALVGASSIVFGASGTLTPPSGALSGNADITFGQSGILTGAGVLSGASSIVFGAAGTLTQPGAIAGNADITFGAGGTLQGTGALSGLSDINFAATGTLVQPPAGPAAAAAPAGGLLPGWTGEESELGRGMGPYKRPGQVFGAPDPYSPRMTSRAAPATPTPSAVPIVAPSLAASEPPSVDERVLHIFVMHLHGH